MEHLVRLQTTLYHQTPTGLEKHPSQKGISKLMKLQKPELFETLFEEKEVDSEAEHEGLYLKQLTLDFPDLVVRVVAFSPLLSECEVWFYHNGLNYGDSLTLSIPRFEKGRLSG